MRVGLQAILFRSDLLAVRFNLAVGAVMAGVGLIVSDELALHSRLPAEAAAFIVLPQWAWGALFATQGGAMLWSLLTAHRSKYMLWLDAVLGVALWAGATLACALFFWPTWAMFLVSPLLASFWILVRYSVNSDCAERRCRTTSK